MVNTKLRINGMMCSMCEAHINDAVRRAFNVKKVTSSHKKGETVILSDEKLDEDKLKEIIAETGYDPESIESRACEEKAGLFGIFHRNRK